VCARAAEAQVDYACIAYVGIRQHTSLQARLEERGVCACRRGTSWLRMHRIRRHTSAYVSIRQHTPAYASIRRHTSAYVGIRLHTSAYVGIRRHTSAYVSIRQRTSAYSKRYSAHASSPGGASSVRVAEKMQKLVPQQPVKHVSS
jgi:hypothetical protein